MRVLATAVDRNPGHEALDRLVAGSDTSLVFTGLQAMLDPPRATAKAAIRNCRTAGLQVKMITGDHAATRRSIARQIGLLDDGEPAPCSPAPSSNCIADDDSCLTRWRLRRSSRG